MPLNGRFQEFLYGIERPHSLESAATGFWLPQGDE